LGDGLNDANRAALVEASPPDTPSKDPSCAKDFRERWAASLAAVGWKVGLVPGGGATALRAPEKSIVFVGDIRMSGMIECRAVRCSEGHTVWTWAAMWSKKWHLFHVATAHIKKKREEEGEGKGGEREKEKGRGKEKKKEYRE
jgi:hypothetical protein